MNPRQFARFTTKWLAAGIGFAAASYATYVGITFLRYGKTKPAEGADTDVLLDTLMPNYEVVDRHKARIAAPPDVALSVAAELNLRSCPAVRGIFQGQRVDHAQQARQYGSAARTPAGNEELGLARIGGGARSRDRCRCCHEAMGAEPGVSRVSSRTVHAVPRTRIRKNHLDVACGSRRQWRNGIPDRNAGSSYRF